MIGMDKFKPFLLKKGISEEVIEEAINDYYEEEKRQWPSRQQKRKVIEPLNFNRELNEILARTLEGFDCTVQLQKMSMKTRLTDCNLLLKFLGMTYLEAWPTGERALYVSDLANPIWRCNIGLKNKNYYGNSLNEAIENAIKDRTNTKENP